MDKDKAGPSGNRQNLYKNKGKDQDVSLALGFPGRAGGVNPVLALVFQEIRRRRNEVTVEIRKHKRDDTLQKRRNVPMQADSTGEKEIICYIKNVYTIGKLGIP